MVKIDRAFYLEELRVHPLERLKLVKSHWPIANENLWIGDIDVELLCLQGADCFHPHLVNFIEQDGYKSDIETIVVNQGIDETLHIELVGKICYLLNSYLKSNSFRDPLCSHYNPRWDKNVVHPGGTRQVILDLFHRGPVKTYYFNTGGIEFEFLKKMKKLDIDEFFIDHKKYYTGIVPDHGTLIPHILSPTGVNTLSQTIIDSHNYYKIKLSNSNYKIFSNFDLKYLSKWRTSKRDRASTVVLFNQEPSLKDHVKASLLILSGNNYVDERLSVVHHYSIRS